jgi:hypothetical protein
LSNSEVMAILIAFHFNGKFHPQCTGQTYY